METADRVTALGVPESLSEFLREACRIQFDLFRPLSGSSLPEPARRLLDHPRDMTSTLAAYHGSPLRVEVLQCRTGGGIYLREVFLRAEATGKIVEFGGLAVVLDRFSAEEQRAIHEAAMPLGALLHRFKIPFVSAPISFFSASGESLAGTPLVLPAGAECFGRFNRLAKPTGETLAWIMEILPPPGA